MKFAHLADCHIGCWRDPKLNKVVLEAFLEAVRKCIDAKVDFVLIAGDLFNTALPSIENLDKTVKILKILKEENIPVYCIPGSHDYSPSGKTMISVLESAGLLINVAKAEKDSGDRIKLKFTMDEKTGAKITGLIGKKGGLESEYYKMLDRESLEKEDGFKIFLFHSAITEFKPKNLAEMSSIPLSLLPKGFSYYAGGHVHARFKQDNIVFPGPLFPANFKEFEELEHGGFCIVDASCDGVEKVEFVPLKIRPYVGLRVNADGKTPLQVKEEIVGFLDKGVENAIVTIRVEGKLSKGKPSDVGFGEIFDRAYEKGAYFVMKNTAQLHGEEFREIKISATSTEEIEEKLIREHLQQFKIGLSKEKEESFIKELLSGLDMDKEEGETTATFEDRLKQNFDTILKKYIDEID